MVAKLGFDKCFANSCLLKCTDNNKTLIIYVYVDDILCIGDRKAINSIKKELSIFFLKKTKEKWSYMWDALW